MTDLRAALIEAVARRMFEAAHPDGKWMRSGSGKKRREVWRQRAVPAIDAFLDTLADRADEWYEAGIPEWDNTNAYQSMKRVVVKSTIRPLIAVLRGDTDG